MHTARLLTLLAFFLVPLVPLCAAGKPNIIFLVSDDAGYNEFSLHGSKLYPTPRIDSIAANGVRFSQAYTSGTVCSPTRAGLLTGRYQNRFGHEFNIPPAMSPDNGLPLTEKTVADALKGAGYQTFAVGKWHLGYAPKFHPMERGFMGYHGFLQGQRSYFPLEKPTKLNRLLRDREPVAKEDFTYMTDELARATAEFIAAKKDAPFFIYVAFNATHGPIQALDSDLAKVPPGGNAKVQAMTMALDRAVGVILDELQKHALTGNTLVAFINDNGGATGRDNTPLRGHKGSTWEGGTRVPFALQWPAVLPKGKVFEHPVISLDLMPTALSAAGVEKPPGQPLDGVDLAPFVTGKNDGRPHQTLFWKDGPKWAVRDGDLKLVSSPAGKENKAEATAPLLFDLRADPSEERDLAAAKPDDVARLKKLHDAWKRDFPKPLWGGRASED
jgi:arylsulfatase A-like enzyme